jgi:hypothetical protein
VELHALFPPNIIWVIKSRIRWVRSLWDVWGRGEVHTGLSGVNMRERDHSADLAIDWKKILKCILKK